MKTAVHPWFPFYPRDFLLSRKVQAMTPTQIGFYLLLLCHQWLEGSVPSSIEDISVICHAKENDERSLNEVVVKCFPPQGKVRLNRRLLRIKREQLSKHQALSEAGKRGAKVWPGPGQGTLTPRPPLGNQNQNQIRTDLLTPPKVPLSDRPKKPLPKDPWDDVLTGKMTAEQYRSEQRAGTPATHEPTPLSGLHDEVLRQVAARRKAESEGTDPDPDAQPR